MFDAETVASFTWRMAAERRGRPSVAEFVHRLGEVPRPARLRGAELLLLGVVDELWAAGWQPAELRRQGRLGCSGSSGARLVSMVIAADHAGRRAATLDGRWVAQVESLGLPATDGRPGWLERWVRDEALEATRATDVVLDAMHNLLHLPALRPLLPPPGGPAGAAAARPAQARGEQADPVLQRVRNLLAKAESTSFEAEATALTAKAQELRRSWWATRGRGGSRWRCGCPSTPPTPT
jgi:hypothetical protein